MGIKTGMTLAPSNLRQGNFARRLLRSRGRWAHRRTGRPAYAAATVCFSWGGAQRPWSRAHDRYRTGVECERARQKARALSILRVTTMLGRALS